MLSVTNNKYGPADVTKNEGLLRRHTFSAGDRHPLDHLNNINNSFFTLRHSSAVSNLALSDSAESNNNLLKLEYNHSNIKNISARDYIYCGMASTVPVNNLGMSIDNDGHLVLIKGKSYDFFKGVLKKYTTGYRYKTARLINSHCDKKFQDLYIDDNGLLIGNEKGTGKSYIITISNPEVAHHSCEQLIALDFKEYNQQNRHDDLTFKIDKDYACSYCLKDNKLYLQSIKKGESVKDYSCMLYEIKMPLHSSQIISSIKRVKGILQVEIKNGRKKRIVFIDPKHISNKNLSVKKISHKPLQTFSSRLGNDPHEKYHAGLPFTSDRKGNFSSKSIPLFSSLVDNFRVNFKNAKQASVEGKNKVAIKHAAKAIDPGVGGIINSISGLARSASKRSGENSNSKAALCDHNISKLLSRSTSLSKVANQALGVNAENQLSESLIMLADIIKPRETVRLSSSDRIAGFFGIASGGIPFAPGWFAGIVMELSEKYDLTIAKTETGNISVSFNNRHSVAATALAGTGQGLERTLLNANKTDYMTVMPLEANAIIVAQSISGSNFSFDMSEEHFREFAGQFSDPTKASAFKEMFVTEAEAEKIQEKAFVIKIEAKSELRLQAGSMVNDHTYMVMPRTAVGARLAFDLLNIQSSASESAGKKEKFFSPQKETLNITALNHEAALFAEWKVMPIAMHGGGDDILWCYPLPLLEEGRTLTEYKSKMHLPVFAKASKESNSAGKEQGFIRVNNICDVRKTPMFIKFDDKKGMKKGVALKKIANMDKEMEVINRTLAALKRSLEAQQRNSQNKSCVIEVVSHYEPIVTPLLSSSEITDSKSAVTTTAAKNRAYRLKKLEFRRSSTFGHKNASIPLPILNFSTVHAITYDQILGEIDFQYQNESALSPFKTTRKMNILY